MERRAARRPRPGRRAAGAAGSAPARRTRARRDRRRPTSRAPRAAPARARRPASGRPPARPRRTTPAARAATGPDPPSRRSVACDRGEHRPPREHHPLRARRSSPTSRRRAARLASAAEPRGQPVTTLAPSDPAESTRPSASRRVMQMSRDALSDASPARRCRPTRRWPAGCRCSRSCSRSARASFLTGSAVFFTQIVGLSARAGRPRPHGRRASSSFVFAVPLGKVADRVGRSGCGRWARSAPPALYAVWPFIDGFAPFLAMMVAARGRSSTAGCSGRGAYTIDVVPARGARAVAGLHARRAQHRLHRRRPASAASRWPSTATTSSAPCRWLTAAILRAQRVLHHPAAPTPQHDRRAGRGRTRLLNPGALRNRGFLALIDLRRRARHQPGAAQRRHPAVAGGGDRRAAGAAGLAVRHQHRDGRAAPGRRGPRRRTPSSGRCAPPGSAPAFFVLSCGIVLVTHDTLGWVDDRAGLARPRDGDRRRAVPVRRRSWGYLSELSDPDRRGEYQGAAHLGGTLGDVVGAGGLHLPRHGVGHAGLAASSPAIVVLATLGMGPAAAGRRALPGAGLEPRRACLLESSVVATRSRSGSPARGRAPSRPRSRPCSPAPASRRTSTASVWWKALLALVVSLALQVGVNYANDYSDGIRGTDDDRVGPMRLVGSGAAAPARREARGVPRLRRRRGRRAGAGGDHRLVAGRRRRWCAWWPRGSTPAARSPTATSASAR